MKLTCLHFFSFFFFFYIKEMPETESRGCLIEQGYRVVSKVR